MVLRLARPDGGREYCHEDGRKSATTSLGVRMDNLEKLDRVSISEGASGDTLVDDSFIFRLAYMTSHLIRSISKMSRGIITAKAIGTSIGVSLLRDRPDVGLPVLFLPGAIGSINLVDSKINVVNDTVVVALTPVSFALDVSVSLLCPLSESSVPFFAVELSSTPPLPLEVLLAPLLLLPG